jgi:N-acyl-D-amino-acid deacylase
VAVVSICLCLADNVASRADSATATGEVTVTTGTANANLASFDSTVINFMEKRNVPGAALAVVKDGRLVYSRGYGWADIDKRVPAQPTSLFRIASISKMFTAAAIMTLVRDGRLKLDSPAFPLLHIEPPANVDPRLLRITVRQLLQHTGGFDRDKSFDPMFRPAEIAIAEGVRAPADQTAIIRYMMGRPLDFDPGTRFAYSNFGYCVLGRVIEAVSGMRYDAYVQKYVLDPVGIQDMSLGRTALGDAAPGEVRYYQPNLANLPSVYPGQGNVPACYGGFNLEAMDSHGGWIASAVDLARFAVNVDSLFPATIAEEMYARPHAPIMALAGRFARSEQPAGETYGTMAAFQERTHCSSAGGTGSRGPCFSMSALKETCLRTTISIPRCTWQRTPSKYGRRGRICCGRIGLMSSVPSRSRLLSRQNKR